ncbi:MAG TPA: hypothetical protein VEK11_10070 [Thermoanaerobaculia bacterium]|nr:hypothetical protein [Thermoanaerobaculia bacterium]
MKLAVIALATALSVSAHAQLLDALRNVSGTTPGVGASPWITEAGSTWSFFYGLDAHVTYVSQTGPEDQENEVFSTNWLGIGAQRNIGSNMFVLARGRVSLEPYTVGDDGYPQLFQYVTPENGGPLIDRMRTQELFGELGVQFGYRPTQSTLISVYGAAVGQPALGAAPWQLRSSGVDFAEAPFAHDIQESFQTATSVVTAQFATGWLSIEGSVFHDSTPSADGTELDMGDIDSNSLRLTIMPSRNFALQVSRGELGEDLRQREIMSASLTYGSQAAAVTALYTTREYANEVVLGEGETAYGIEVALRGARNTFMVRAEHVERPAGFPLFPFGEGVDDATHLTAGYVFDLMNTNRYRAGLGVNIDYRTQTHDLEEIYGHKPQGIYAFVRLRTNGQ